MKHIRQIGSNTNSNESYIVVETTNYPGDLEDHPSIIDHPNLFEVVDCEIPDNFQYLIYQP